VNQRTNPRQRGLGNPHRRALVLLVAVIAAVVGSVGTGARLASAHASLVSTSPSAGEVLDEAPDEVLLIFDEGVDLGLGEVRVLDGSGAEVGGIGEPEHPNGDGARVTAAVPELPDGSYIVSWNVVSQDGHPIAGAFTFQVGQVNDLQAGVLASIDRDSDTPVWLEVSESTARAVLYAALALALGGLAFLVLARPDAGGDRIRRIAAIAAFAAAAAALVLIPLQAEAARKGSLGDLGTWWDLWRTSNGEAQGVRMLAMVVVGMAVVVWGGWRRWALTLAGVAGLIAVLASAPAGHGASGRWQNLGAVLTVVHVGAMAVWLGGLVALAVVVKIADADVAKRFSPIASISMLLVVASGTIQAIRQLGSFDALADSTYGKWLLLKVGAALLVICGAVASRYATYGGLFGDRRTDREVLRRALAFELVAAIVVLGATGALTGTPPPGNTPTVYSTTATSGDYLMSLTVDPVRSGPTEMHIYLSSPSGSLDQPDTVTATLANPGRDVADVQLQLEPSGPGHYSTLGATLPFTGTWTITVEARYGEFDLVTFRTTFDVT
jgi:copper transport protein